MAVGVKELFSNVALHFGSLNHVEQFYAFAV